jgi:hypothetical protein
MATSKNDDTEDEAVIMERMNKALKVMMSTPPETHREMVERRHKASGQKHKDEPKRGGGVKREKK